MSWFNKTTDHLAQILTLEKRIESLEKEQVINTSNHNLIENRVVKTEENLKAVAEDAGKHLLDLQQKVNQKSLIHENIKALDSQITTTFTRLTDSIQEMERKIIKMEEEFHSQLEHVKEENQKLKDKVTELETKTNDTKEKVKPNFVLPKKKTTE